MKDELEVEELKKKPTNSEDESTEDELEGYSSKVEDSNPTEGMTQKVK